jgi:hypothetical protein
MPDMFDSVRLVGTPMQGLALETRSRTRIRNIVGLDKVAWGQEQKFKGMCRTFAWTVRRPPTGLYNCAGHVWASRRTGLHEPEDYETILREDGYRPLNENEPPRQGDLVLYRLDETNEILHVGEVIEVREVIPGAPGGRGVPWILSKIDSTSGEVMHPVGSVPYDQQGLRYRCEFRTDRPNQEVAP